MRANPSLDCDCVANVDSYLERDCRRLNGFAPCLKSAATHWLCVLHALPLAGGHFMICSGSAIG
jgi:hypothetical protein